MKKLEKLKFEQLGKKELSQVNGGEGFEIGQGEMDGIFSQIDPGQIAAASTKFDNGPSRKFDTGPSRKFDDGPSRKFDGGVVEQMFDDEGFTSQYDEEEHMLFYDI